MLGATLSGRYKIRRLLGEGGMGGVYEAEDSKAGRSVAVKVIHRTIIGRDPKLLQRFRREAMAASAIDCEHVVKLYDTGTDEPTDSPFIVMELLDGEDLRSVLRRVVRLSVDASLRISAQLLRALVKAHAVGVVHRDIKPGNVLLASVPPRLIVKLLDFGIAKLLVKNGEEEPATLTATHDVVGTPVYMSPEQARGLKDIDFRSDLWSVGMVLYRCLAGRPGYDTRGSFAAFIAAIVNGPPEPLASTAPWVPGEVTRIVDRALAMKPADRYPTAAEMLADIEQLLPTGADLSQADLVASEPVTVTEVTSRVVASAVTTSDRPTRNDRQGPHVAASVPRSAADHEAPSSVTTRAVFRPSPQSGESRKPNDVRGRRTWWLLAFAGLGALAGIAFLQQMAPRPVDGQSAPSVASPSPPPTVVARLSIEPTDAEVEIDGARITVASGMVEIRSPVGAVHQVRVMKGGRETKVSVTVTAQGVEPAAIALPIAEAQIVAVPPRSSEPGRQKRGPSTSATGASPSHPTNTPSATPARSASPPAPDPIINGHFE